VILIKGVEVARYELMRQGMELALTAASRRPDRGEATREPAFGIARRCGSVPAGGGRARGRLHGGGRSGHHRHPPRRGRTPHAHELFSRQDAKRLLDRVAEENPKVVEDLVPKLLPLATVQRVLQNLLRERVSIRDAVTILEALGEAAQITRNPVCSPNSCGRRSAARS
jgi:flagellar biosynthesis protein FlhA